ncbi:MAG: helix-turn-helix domain-containing protein [Inquilinaceae bacterium]
MVAGTLTIHRPGRVRPGGSAPRIGAPSRRPPGAWGRRGRAPVIWAGASRHAALDRAKALLDASLAENIPLGRLALLVGLGPSRLSELFRQAEGVGPHGYLIRRRVDQARRLLEQGGTPADVAAACGFADQSHLTRALKKRTGLTPGRIARQAARDGKDRKNVQDRPDGGGIGSGSSAPEPKVPARERRVRSIRAWDKSRTRLP